MRLLLGVMPRERGWIIDSSESAQSERIVLGSMGGSVGQLFFFFTKVENRTFHYSWMKVCIDSCQILEYVIHNQIHKMYLVHYQL